MAIEHVLDCGTQQGVDRDYEGGSLQLIVSPELARQEERREAALGRLKTLALSDAVVADLLCVLGVDGG